MIEISNVDIAILEDEDFNNCDILSFEQVRDSKKNPLYLGNYQCYFNYDTLSAFYTLVINNFLEEDLNNLIENYEIKLSSNVIALEGFTEPEFYSDFILEWELEPLADVIQGAVFTESGFNDSGDWEVFFYNAVINYDYVNDDTDWCLFFMVYKED